MTQTKTSGSGSASLAAGGRETGKVKWFDSVRGYGFIFADADGEELFVHKTEARACGIGDLADQMPVSFMRAERDGKWRATNVRPEH